jgi:RNA polymerase sigma factor (sigma-70 family)
MHENSTKIYQSLLDRLRAGDPAARNELIEQSYHRFYALAAKILRESFGRLDRDVESVIGRAYPRVVRALESVRPDTPADYFRLLALKVRHALLDLIAEEKRAGLGPPGDGSTTGAGLTPPDPGTDPGVRAMWEEVYRRVDDLPADQKQVFDLHCVQNLTQAEVGEILGLPPKQVSRLWLDALDALKSYIPDRE